MIEIKFRGKLKETGKWIYGYLIKGKYCYILTKDDFYNAVVSINGHMSTSVNIVIPESVGQYIGICDDTNDKNNLYSGDIISYYNSYSDKTYIGVIKYDERQCCFAIFDKYTDEWERECDWMKIKNVKKLGNIFDNPELLMEEK